MPGSNKHDNAEEQQRTGEKRKTAIIQFHGVLRLDISIITINCTIQENSIFITVCSLVKIITLYCGAMMKLSSVGNNAP